MNYLPSHSQPSSFEPHQWCLPAATSKHVPALTGPFQCSHLSINVGLRGPLCIQLVGHCQSVLSAEARHWVRRVRPRLSQRVQLQLFVPHRHTPTHHTKTQPHKCAHATHQRTRAQRPAPGQTQKYTRAVFLLCQSKHPNNNTPRARARFALTRCALVSVKQWPARTSSLELYSYLPAHPRKAGASCCLLRRACARKSAAKAGRGTASPGRPTAWRRSLRWCFRWRNWSARVGIIHKRRLKD